MYWGRFIVCLLFGWLGIHKFMEKKIGMGFLYLFTLGLFGIGWLVDIVRYFWRTIRHGKVFGKIAAGVLGALVILGLAAGGSDEAPTDQPEIQMTTAPTAIVEATATAEPTVFSGPTATIAPTTEPTATVEPTAAPTEEPTESPTEKPTAVPTKKPMSDSDEDAATNAKYVASKNSEVFHKVSCGKVQDIKDKNKLYYESREEAARTRRPCKNCNP